MAIAVVTGSSTGIGQASAVALARAGHTVLRGAEARREDFSAGAIAAEQS